MKPDSVIRSVKSWEDFEKIIFPLNTTEKGNVFARVVQLYLKTDPEYVTKLKDVWLLREVPRKIRQDLLLPNLDEGIDLIAHTQEGKYWSIQAKYRSNHNERLRMSGKGGLSTFTSLSFHTCDNIEFGLVCATTNLPIKKTKLTGPKVSFRLLDTWLALDDNKKEGWKRIINLLGGKPTKPKKLNPKKHQKAAIRKAYQHYIKERQSRGKMIMPCGTGKSLASVWIAQKLKAKSIVVCVPSLALIKQSINVWTREYLAHGIETEWLCVCSDTAAGEIDIDDFTAHTYDMGIKCETKTKEIVEFLSKRRRGVRIIFTTYQSGQTFAKASRKAGSNFDLAILDEAHRTVVQVGKPFSHLLYDKNLKAKKRLYMTATERRPRSNSNKILSMDDPIIYGKTFQELSFKKAIETQPPIICDYKIITIEITEKEIENLWKENRLLRITHTKLDDVATRSLAGGITLFKTIQKHRLKRAITFHGSIPKAERFRDQCEALTDVFPYFKSVDFLHTSSKNAMSERTLILRDFENAKKAVITNARCLNEGVDIPSVDCVLFSDPKRSKVDIVQAAGRALRIADKKQYGYIIIPVIVPDDTAIEDYAESSAFREVINIISYLAAQDTRIVDYFRAISQGKRPRSGPIIIDISDTLAKKIDPDKFHEALNLKIWKRIAKLNWRPFEEAREFARALKLKSNDEWLEYIKGQMPEKKRLPDDIPKAPEYVYKNKGWVDWGDWTGSGNIAPSKRKPRPFKQAREYARALNLETSGEWKSYCQGKIPGIGIKPDDIPVNPDRSYKDEGWVDWGDWLGTGTIATQKRKYLTYKQAREFVHGLKLKSQREWKKYSKGELLKKGQRPDNIPGDPQTYYKDKGWIDWLDWLGTGTIATRKRKPRPFRSARKFARALKLKSRDEWNLYCQGKIPGKERLPDDMPKTPHHVYKSKGWKGVRDWLGY